MASPSSRRKNGLSSLHDEVKRLLCDGYAFDAPSEKLYQAASLLAEQGLVVHRLREYVICANPKDRDFQYTRNRSCVERIYLEDEKDLDEDGNDYQCASCERVIYPRGSGKETFRQLQITVNLDGVLAYIEQALRAYEANPQKYIENDKDALYCPKKAYLEVSQW